MLALIFPGQGSQEVGMGRDVHEASAAARATFAEADAALGFELSRICFAGPEEDLLRTELQQPAILATSVALLRALAERAPVSPSFVAGHSLGEYTALVASGALPFEDAVRLVHARGRFMQEAVPQGRGAMAAVLGLDPVAVGEVCEEVARESGLVVAPANFNGPVQTVVAGDARAVELACSRARERGARRSIPLEVSAPFHCAMMEPAAEKLAPELWKTRFSDPRPPVVSNVEAEPCGDGARIADLLRRQVTAPVRFTQMISRMRSLGVTRVLEVGPGRVLSGLVGRIDRSLARASCSGVSELATAQEFVAATD